jgi:hypothetical protein
MKIWIKRCKEPDKENWTFVPYVSKHKIIMNTKFRRSVVRKLLKEGCGVYGGCNPIHREVRHVILRLNGQTLNKTLLASLLKECNNKLLSGSLIFYRSRNYPEIIRWLSYELSRRNALRNDELSWKQKKRKIREWY